MKQTYSVKLGLKAIREMANIDLESSYHKINLYMHGVANGIRVAKCFYTDEDFVPTGIPEVIAIDEDQKIFDSLGGSVIPLNTVDPQGKVVETLVCTSISGGADEINGMPRRLVLLKKTETGEKRCAYIFVKELKPITTE